MDARYAPCTVLAAGLLLALTPSAKGQTAPPLSGIPFLHGIDVSMNGSAPMHFGLDTGLSVGFSITPENAKRLGLPVSDHHTIHSSDRQEVPGMVTDIFRATTLIVAGHIFSGPGGVTMPEAHQDGTLGIALFRDVLLTLDYPHDRLSIADGTLPLPNGRDIIAYTTDPNANASTPTVMIQLAGQTLPAVLDTGVRELNADLIVPTRVAATLPLGPTESTITISDVMGNKFPSRTARLTGDLILGEVVLHNPTVLVSDWLGVINLARVSNRLILTIDQRNHRLRVAMPNAVPFVAQ